MNFGNPLYIFSKKSTFFYPKGMGLTLKQFVHLAQKYRYFHGWMLVGVGLGGLGVWRWGKSKIKTNSISRAGAGTEFVSLC